MAKKFSVFGTVIVNVTMTVEADDADEAIEIAEAEFELNAYCGNGGSDQLVGVDDERISLDPGDSRLQVEEEEVREVDDE